MKVKELIEKLKRCNQESEVIFQSEEWVGGYNESEIGYNTNRIYDLIEDNIYDIVTIVILY